MIKCILWIWVVLFCWDLSAEEYSEVQQQNVSTEIVEYESQDTLKADSDASPDADQCLQGLIWKPERFTVSVQKPQTEHGDRLVQFSSAVISGDNKNDVVSMEWSMVKNEKGVVQKAPAIVVVHESGSNMKVGRLFAGSLRHLGFHTFMLQMPYYGLRRTNSKQRHEANQVSAMKQAVADVRRARDAVAVLPEVDARTICLQGTSLGGFVSTTAASLDGKYDGVFLMLAGGDLYDIVQNGKKDAAKARERLAKQGLTGEKLKKVTQAVEPTRIAHRLNPKRVWLYSGMFDTVVPPKNADLLAATVGLLESHHIKMPANHYSGVVFLPMVFTHIQKEMNALHASAPK